MEEKGQRHPRHQGTGTGRDPRGEGAWRGEDAAWGNFAEGAKQNSNARNEKQTGKRRSKKARAGCSGEREVGRGTKRRKGLETGGRLEGDWRALQWTGGAPLTLLALASLPRLRFPHLL